MKAARRKAAARKNFVVRVICPLSEMKRFVVIRPNEEKVLSGRMRIICNGLLVEVER
jgi:hypothetical protein